MLGKYKSTVSHLAVSLDSKNAPKLFQSSYLPLCDLLGSLHAIPAISLPIVQRFSRSDGVILSGDCRMDSPGFSAIKGAYSLMDHESKTITSMKHGDKRQVRSLVL